METRQQQEQKRTSNFVLSIIGTNRTGKTSKAKQIIRDWKKNNPNGTVIVFDPQSKMSGMANLYLKNIEEDWYKDIFRRANDGSYVARWKAENGCLLVLDDYRVLHENDKTEAWLKILMAFREEWNMDFIYICHSPALVLNFLTTYTNYYYVFYTKAIDKKWKDRIPDYDLCIQATMIMQLYVNKFGKGQYPNFPHCVVDCDNNKLRTQNITKDKWQKILHPGNPYNDKYQKAINQVKL